MFTKYNHDLIDCMIGVDLVKSKWLNLQQASEIKRQETTALVIQFYKQELFLLIWLSA